MAPKFHFKELLVGFGERMERVYSDESSMNQNLLFIIICFLYTNV